MNPVDRPERWPIERLIPYARNARTHSDVQIAQIAASIREWGWTTPILVDADGTVLAGHGRLAAARQLQMTEVPVIIASGWSDAKRRAYILADNKLALNAGWDDQILALELADLGNDFDLNLIGFTEQELETFAADPLDANKKQQYSNTSLSERFMLPPFTVLNAREGWWQERKRSWLALGIESEVGRDSKLPYKSDSGNDPSYYTKKREIENRIGRLLTTEEFQRSYYTGNSGSYESGTSIFDPVLCEIAYKWFSPEGAIVIDPFAGGSVRGIVASKLKRQYIGHELREEQVSANKKQGAEICTSDDYLPAWICGDSRNIDKTCANVDADFVFSCPPYVDLEMYSDDPKDLSTLGYSEFKVAYFDIIKKTCDRLKNNRFACFVVGEVRDKNGNYYNFVGDTVDAFIAAGLHYYNEAILVTAVGSLPIRTGKHFSASRKLGKTHQNILVFVKGDARQAANVCGEVEVSIPDEAVTDA